jgi:hypothetical protein
MKLNLCHSRVKCLMDVRPLVSKISVIISGRGVATTILLNSAGDNEDTHRIIGRRYLEVGLD